MRRVLKISAWTFGVVALAVLLLGAMLLIAGNTAAGRAMLERLTHRLTSGHVSLTGLNGVFPQHLTVERVQLSDDLGVWLSAERVTVDWTPLALLARRLQIDALHASLVDMERLPHAPPGTPSTAPASIPRIDVAEVKVDEAKLGAQLVGSPASLTLRGNAHLRSLLDMVIAVSARRINGDGEYTVDLNFDTKRMDAVVKLHEPAGGPLENLLQLPGLGALAATLQLNGARSAERLVLSIDAGALRGRAQGSFNLDELSADLDFSLEAPAMVPRSDLAWERAMVRGRWHGTVKAPHADVHVDAEKLRWPGGIRFATLSGDVSADQGAAALHALIAGLEIPGMRQQLLRDSPVTIDASMRLDDPALPLELSATHRLFSMHALARAAAIGKRQFSAALELRLPNLGEFAALAGENVRGTALLKAQLRGDGTAAQLDLDASAALRAGTEVWSGVVGESPTLRLTAAMTDRAITIDNLKFTGRALSLAASGELSRPGMDTLHARWNLDAWDLKALSPSLAGTLRGSGSIDGATTALALEAQLASTLAVRDSPAGTLMGALKVRGWPSNPSGTLQAQGSLDGAPLNLDIAAERAPGGSVRTLVRRADWKSAHVDGDINVAPVAAQSHGQLRVAVGSLADLQDLLGANVAGMLAGNIVLRPDHGRTSVQLQLDARDLAAGPFAGNAQLTAEGVTDALEFKLGLQAPDLRGAPASLSAAGSLNLEARRIAVASVTAIYHGQDLRLLSPAQISLAKGVSVDDLKVGAKQAVLEIKGTITPALALSASLRGVQPDLVNMFVPELLAAGTIEAQAQLQGSVAAPTGQVRITATNLVLADDAALGLPSLDMHANAELAGDTADVEAKLTAGTASKLSVTGRAPLHKEGALNLKISGSLDLAMINPLLEARGQRAAGDISIDATIGGGVAAPQIEGTVGLAKGSLRDYARGVSLTDITASVVGSEGLLQIKSFTAAAAPGTIIMTGTIGVLQAGIPLDLKIKADRAQPLVSKLVTSNLNAEIRVVGKARERLDIDGTVHLNHTLIGVPNSLPPDVAVLDVRRRGKAAAPVPEKPLVIGLDIALEAPQEFLVQGRGLDAEMGGDLHITGTTDTPVVSGGFDLQRGSFSLSSNKLSFTAGRVSFNGAGLKNRIDPTLDFTAQTAMSDATVTLHVAGYADAPQFEFTSSPALPQDEIMARLLFGQNIAQLSGLQVAQIGAALATLSGVGGNGGLNPLVRIQKSLGLDRLTVGSGATTNTAAGTENTGASIAAGRYITKRVYVEAKQTTLGTSQLETDVDLTKHLKLQTRLGNGSASVQGTTPENDPGSSVGLIYQFEY